MASHRSSSDGGTMLWKECMSRDSIGVMGERLGSKTPIERFSMSTTGFESKEVENTLIGSFSLAFEGMGHDTT